jgi:sugar phosphate isomerase/epimerase
MKRRTFLGSTSSFLLSQARAKNMVPLGIDVFSLRSQGWTPFQYLDYCAQQKAQVCFFSELRFLQGTDKANLEKIKAHADGLGLKVEVGNRSICPSSRSFDPKAGAAEEQLSELIRIAVALGSPVARCFLGSMADRQGEPGIEAHIANTVKVLKAVRRQALDAGVKVAIENHAGDMQARELKALVEEAGPDFTGVCIDSGNPVWALEDPHLTLEMLHPYVVASGIRDSLLWRTPEGVAVRWVRMGEGNVNIEKYVRDFARLCPGRTLALEIIVTPQPRMFSIYDSGFWDAYRKMPAWEFARFLSYAEKGRPQTEEAPPKERAAEKERLDLEASVRWTQKILEAI